MHQIEIEGRKFSYRNAAHLDTQLRRRIEVLGEQERFHTGRLQHVRNELRAIARYMGVRPNSTDASTGAGAAGIERIAPPAGVLARG